MSKRVLHVTLSELKTIRVTPKHSGITHEIPLNRPNIVNVKDLFAPGDKAGFDQVDNLLDAIHSLLGKTSSSDVELVIEA